MSGLLRGLVRERACRGGAEGEARSAVLYWGSLTVPRAEAAGTRGRGVPGDGAWHWDVRAPDTVSTPPTGGARALSFGASHPAPSPWVELGSTQGVVWCGVVWCGVVWCAEGAVTRRQWPGCLPTGTGKRAGLCVLCARCVLVCCCIAGPVHTCTWLALLRRRLCAVTQALIDPLHPACRAAPSVLSVWCRTARCCALHCTVCALLHCCCGQRAVGSVTHCHAAWGLWAVEILLRTAALPEGSGEWFSCRSLPPCLGAVGRASPAIHCRPAWGSGQWHS